MSEVNGVGSTYSGIWALEAGHERKTVEFLHALGKILPKPLYKAALYLLAHLRYSFHEGPLSNVLQPPLENKIQTNKKLHERES